MSKRVATELSIVYSGITFRGVVPRTAVQLLVSNRIR